MSAQKPGKHSTDKLIPSHFKLPLYTGGAVEWAQDLKKITKLSKDQL